MIDSPQVTRLLAMRAPAATVVSVYLTVPLDPAERRGIPARVDELLRAARQSPAGGAAAARARRSQLPVIRDAVSAQASDWPGHTLAVLACRELGMLEVIPLRGRVTEQAAVGTRPYLRPLLAELRRRPRYAAAVIDRRRAWLFRVSGEVAEPLASVQGDTVGSRRFGGWHGLAAYRNQRRARELAGRHYAQIVAALGKALAEGGCGPVAVGGHEAETAEFLGALPAALRERVAGTFVIDPHTMTPAIVRRLAGETVSRWRESRENGLAAMLASQPAGEMSALGLAACLEAANQHAIALLAVPDDRVTEGFSCQRCDGLAAAAGPCPVCAGPVVPVPDVIEELAVKVAGDGGTVEPVPADGALADVAARRRFPPPRAAAT